MSVFDIRASDKGPRHARPPRTKQPRGGGGSGGGGGTKGGWCGLLVATPVFTLALAFIGLLSHAP